MLEKISCLKQLESTSPGHQCPDGKYWVPPYLRKRKGKDGKIYTQHVNGYCTPYHDHFADLAKEEKMPLDYLFFALTVYGEAAMESIYSKKAIAWVIKNRRQASKKFETYRDIVLKKNQFSCWLKSDPNYKRLEHPGKHDSIDFRAWQDCKLLAEEVDHEPENNNPLPGVYHYFSGEPNIKKHPWQKKYFDLPGVPNFHFVRL